MHKKNKKQKEIKIIKTICVEDIKLKDEDYNGRLENKRMIIFK